MDFITKNGVTWFSFSQNSRLLAGFSTRIGGFSKGEYASMNLGINTNDDKEIIDRNRNLFFNTVALGFKVNYLNQIHTADILNVDSPDFRMFCEGDGLFTTSRNALLSVTIADCGSVLFHDENFSFACAIHCGWKGVQQGIISKAVELISQYADLSNVSAYIGPMIRCPHYEVGREFLNYFDPGYFVDKDGKLYFDLNMYIINKLTRSGISSIVDCGFDTYFSPEYFFSHRRNNAAGRIVAFIGITDDAIE